MTRVTITVENDNAKQRVRVFRETTDHPIIDTRELFISRDIENELERYGFADGIAAAFETIPNHRVNEKYI